MLKDSKKRIMLIRTIFVVYAVIMAYFLFFRRNLNIGDTYWEQISRNINVVPFFTIKQNLHLILEKTNPYLVPYAIINLLGNIVGFIPFGILVPVLFQRVREFSKFFFCAIGSILLIECIQLFTLRGSFDIDDWILNMSGSLFGYAIYRFIRTNCRPAM